jgi:hypothetical protein
MKRAYTATLTEQEINKIIREAESNPPSDLWDFCTDQGDLISFLNTQIRQNGRIKIEKI